MQKKHYNWLALTLALAGIGAAAVNRSAVAAEPATNPAAAAASPPIVLPATIEPFEQADLYAKVSGYFSEINADIGDVVKAGQVLAVIDQPELEAELAEARATAASKEQLRKAAEAGVKQAEAARDVAKRQVERARAEVMLMNATLRRQEQLHSGKAITEQQLDEVRSKAEVARSDVGIAEAKLISAEADVTGAGAARAVAEAQVQVAAAQTARVESLRRYLKIVAPFDGVVSRRLVNRGDLAQAAVAARTAALFTVQRVDVVRVRCDVPESASHQIGRGTAVAVKLVSAGGDPIVATVSRTAGSLNPETRTMRIEIDLPNPQRRLVPGTYAQVTFTTGPAARVADGAATR
jgi:multidrug efflux pump subunit AcrA (membrane-fusion protein)